MFSKDVDVAEIMKEIREKAIKKSEEDRQSLLQVATDSERSELERILAQLDNLFMSIGATYNYTKKHEETALNIPCNHNRTALIRKSLTFIRRLIRKVTSFIWREQNEVNKSLNANIYALYQAQLAMSNNFNILNNILDSIDAINGRTNSIIERINGVDERINGVDERVNGVDGRTNSIIERINSVDERVDNIVSSVSQIKVEQTKNRDFATQLRKNVNEKYMTSPHIEIGKEQMRDQMYLWLEDEFRGSREEIKRRQSYYIESYIVPHIRDKEKDYALDIGCGRGEWLELLKENGVRAKGVDINPEMVKLCLNLGLDVIQTDAFEYIKSLPDESVKIITGFHIVEHLPFHLIEAYLFECYRVLQHHGMVIFETPNARNLRVGSYNFYLDPSHSKPIHDKAIDFVARSVGYYETKIVYPLEADASKYWDSITKINESNESLLPEIRAVTEIVKNNLHCSEDYALIAIK